LEKRLLDQNAILKLTFDFSLMLITYCEKLNAARYFVIANQLLKSGTSIGANAMEAQNAESKADFIHKMKVAAKEAEETQYWLMLCEYSENLPECTSLVMKLDEIQKVLSKILGTSKRK
jgi:four helix bundle protein